MEFARRARRLYRDREGVVDGGLRFTFGEFLERCDRWSAALQALGVGQSDRVAYIAPNTHTHLEAYYAVPQIGAVLVPINFRLKPEDFAYIINHCGAKAVCVHPDHVAAVDSIRDQIPGAEVFVALEGSADSWLHYEQILASHGLEFEPVEISESDLITINYTSGTTARPKGVMITHRNAYINIMGTLAHHHLSPADRYLWTLPMFHANGWTFTWINTARGMTHVCLRKVEPAAIYQLIKEEEITMFCAAPTVLISIANAPKAMREGAPRGVRLFTAGAPPAAATIELVEKDLGWELTHVYGLTETAPLITFCEPRPEHQGLSIEERSKMKARQGVELVSSGEVRVVDENGLEVAADGNTLGEITVRGNVVMAGYYNDPEATAAAIKDGWFHSGDAAVVHPDGYVEIRDRFKDVIISGGENISSVELEGCLLTHPAVQESAVVGMPHEKWGESPHAFVVLKEGAHATEDELKQHVRSQLAHFKTPQAVTFVEELPKTATGKVQKYVLRQHQPGIATQ
ncbi:MAG: long-chain-fatty-acid--CoA ligase [Arenicellales bacterium]|jgi:fatty-acyl-CoA synthase|nr:long-chain-fatty-acid--CoA ligase [Arenicellales bacterium]MDP6791402.1 long-chain-fatty-acid--CoA ligase [Arenicellales bacterium]MDP6919536.1 long-chain-fatty-acid--CoA ligase [Arenicellales bacterium]|tara:strand:+ start:16588 stop:18138 length:1551 start_codon:yes stop_codon:yes gene_type:complete